VTLRRCDQNSKDTEKTWSVHGNRAEIEHSTGKAERMGRVISHNMAGIEPMHEVEFK
jgi:hypothetical protein